MGLFTNPTPILDASMQKSCDNRPKRFVVFINGPPRSGKDEAANVIQFLCFLNDLNCRVLKMAEPIRKVVCALLGWDTSIEKQKSEPFWFGKGKSLRDFMISFSEDFMKPQYGEDIFGRFAAREIKKTNQEYPKDDMVYVFSDAGFECEISPILKEIEFDRVVLLKLTRKGYTFKNDSRSYIAGGDSFTDIIEIENNGSLADFKRVVREKILNVIH